MATVGSPVWGAHVWGAGVWGAHVWPGTTTETTASGGGMRVRKRYVRPSTDRAKVPADGTLYRQMFPDKPVESTTVEPTHKKPLPIALLMAWMAMEDD